jgi:glucose-1-phosphate thymidylyltransferase
MKGIILAGGTGSRLYPVTKSVCKQLLPVYDKPLIYYPLSTLMLAGITEILIISTEQDKELYQNLFNDGSQLGISISYAVQKEPNGIAEAFIIGEEFIGNDNVCLILGDNIFYGHGLSDKLKQWVEHVDTFNTSVIVGYRVNDPERFGVVEFDDHLNILSLEEKPKVPKSNYAVVGLYFYNNDVVNISKMIRPSKRGELEITEVNKFYLSNKKLDLKFLGRGFAWLDTGTPSTLLEASKLFEILEQRTGIKIGCLEEIAYNSNYINKSDLEKIIDQYNNTDYGKYLKLILNEDIL